MAVTEKKFFLWAAHLCIKEDQENKLSLQIVP